MTLTAETGEGKKETAGMDRKEEYKGVEATDYIDGGIYTSDISNGMWPDEDEEVHVKKNDQVKRRKTAEVTIELASPSPRPPTDVEHDEDDEAEDEDEDDDEECGDELEEEEQVKEMTMDEKKEMYMSVLCGDIELLEDCLDKPNADINMVWYNENLLMTAVREGHEDMAEFLLDNGVDYTYSTSVMGLRDTPKGKLMDKYELTCRQMAYDREMLYIVSLIDLVQGNVFTFIKPLQRTPRLRRPKPPMLTGSNGTGSGRGSDDGGGSGSRSDSEGEDHTDQGGLSGVWRKTREKKRRRKEVNEKDLMDKYKLVETVSMFGEGFEADFRHHNLGSNKLKAGLVREHDMLSERKENVNSNNSVTSPRSQTMPGYQRVCQSGKEVVLDAIDVHDDGYGSISVKSTSPCISLYLKPVQLPTKTRNRIPFTKSDIAMQRINQYGNLGGLNGSYVMNNQDKPMKWKKVSTFGSYAKECNLWQPKKMDEDLKHNSVSYTYLDTSSRTTGLAPSVSAVSPTLYRIAPVTSTPGHMKSTISFNRSVCSSSSSSQQQVSNLTRYMQLTKSTMTKQRLSPKFVTSYAALSFTNVIHSRSESADMDTSTDLSKRSSISIKANRSFHVPCVPCVEVLQKRTKHTLSFRR